MYFPFNDTVFIVLSALILFILFSAGVVLVLWIAMPFSVFGVKGILRRLLEEQERTNRLLEAVLEESQRRKETGAAAEKTSEAPYPGPKGPQEGPDS